MPKAWFGSGSAFDTYRSRLSTWLRAHMDEVTPLSPVTVELYGCKGIISGWQIKSPFSGWRFYVLLDEGFPFSHIKIAYVGKCQHLKWPHVENNGFLCLPVDGWRPIEQLDYSIQERLNLAIQLLEDCQSEAYVKAESATEFLTYWGRAAKGEVLSHIDLTVLETRLVVGLKTDRYWLVGENYEALSRWVSNHGKLSPGESFQAIFGYIEEPPSLPFPISSKQFISQFLNQCPHINAVIGRLSPFKETVVMLAVRSREGTSLIGVRLSAIPQNGFRKQARNKQNRIIPSHRVKSVWAQFSRLEHIRVIRTDSDWVHGRGLDPHHRTLAYSRVMVLGAGSLGSQVASRLAQAGVGNITIVDPEELDSSNVGRHALGIDSVRESKAKHLASQLSSKYPHGDFQGFKACWQDVLREKPSTFKDADLFVSCIAESEHDLLWDSWFRSGEVEVPTVYGWLGTHGTTGHALALTSGSPGLSCYFDPDGFVRQPDTDFQGNTKIKVEPGCGAEFQPYGPLSVGQVELLVTRLSLDILTDKVVPPEHRVFTCSTADLRELNGEWTTYHQKYRPEKYDGPLEYRPAIIYCGECYQCEYP